MSKARLRLSDLLKAPGVTEECKEDLRKLKKQKRKAIPKRSPQKAHINFVLQQQFGDHLKHEHKFSDERRFRFDWAVPSLKIAFEYEGIVSQKSRHTTLTGYSRDTDKYRLANQLGWRVYRYTALNYQQIWDDVENILH